MPCIDIFTDIMKLLNVVPNDCMPLENIARVWFCRFHALLEEKKRKERNGQTYNTFSIVFHSKCISRNRTISMVRNALESFLYVLSLHYNVLWRDTMSQEFPAAMRSCANPYIDVRIDLRPCNCNFHRADFLS